MIFPKIQIAKILSSKAAVIAAVLIIALFGFFYGERMETFGMWGDEINYTRMTLHFPEAVSEHLLDDYHFQRILPSALVYFSLRLLRQPVVISNIITAYGVLNIGLLVLMGFFWCRISDELKISRKGLWLGFVALFCNYPILKYIPYVQVSTDLYGYVVGLALVFFYLRNNLVGLFITTILGAFCWPTAVYVGTLFILFPREEEGRGEAAPAPYGINFIIACAVTLIVFSELHIIMRAMMSGRIFSLGLFALGANRPIMSILPLSMGVVLVYVFAVISTLLNNRKYFNFQYWLSQFKWFRFVMAVFLFVGLKFVVSYFSSIHNAVSFDHLIKNVFMGSVINPGIFLVAHVAYFGPLVALLFLLWRPFCRYVQSFGPGLFICILLATIYSLDGESRRLINFYPLFVPFLVKLIDDLEWKQSFYWLIFVFSVIFSKVWLRIHAQPWGGTAQEFPVQYYYMSMGPWMSHQMYVVQGAVVLFVVLAIYLLMFRDKEAKRQY